MYSFTVLLWRIAIKLFISSLIVDNPKSATGIGEIEDKKLNCPAPDESTTAFDVYHFGNKRDTIIEIIDTMATLLKMNFLLFQKRRKVPRKLSSSLKL
tara:strand:+ start:417 stop:710 length:294 start_codon:yes stop_codon:yes gene_type:complete